MFGLYRWWRRRWLRKLPLSAADRSVLDSIPLLAGLGLQERARLEAEVRVFLAERVFEGCAGFEVSDRARLVIAAQACLLTLNLKQGFTRLGTILVYPSAFRAKGRFTTREGFEEEYDHEHLGESWDHGNVVLSWDDIELDLANPDDGFNVVLHEFAHQLDAETGEADGTPPLPDRELARIWPRVMKPEFERLGRLADALDELEDREGPDERPRPDDEPLDEALLPEDLRGIVLDDYGATDPAEFFAVATEAFFEDARALKDSHAALYDLLRRFYGQDPAER